MDKCESFQCNEIHGKIINYNKYVTFIWGFFLAKWFLKDFGLDKRTWIDSLEFDMGAERWLVVLSLIFLLVVWQAKA